MMHRYTIDVISSMVYGLNSGNLKESYNKFRLLGLKSFECGALSTLAALFYMEILQKFNIPFLNKESKEFFVGIFNKAMKHRRENVTDRNDILNLLRQIIDKGSVEDDEQSSNVNKENKENIDLITETEAAAQALGIFLAGFEASASIATMFLLEIALYQDIQNKLHDEIDEIANSPNGFTYDNIIKLEYLDMVFTETLRKYPALAFLNRLCEDDFHIPNSNFTIPKGMRIVIPVMGIHHDPKYFSDPMKFDPLRFSKESTAPNKDFNLLTFGNGPRYCIEDYQIPYSYSVIPKGMRIVISTGGIHHDSRYFPDSYKFDPTRFNKENISFNGNNYFAFGDGPRNCIGKRFRIMQTKHAIALLVYNYNFSFCEKIEYPVKITSNNFLGMPAAGVYFRIEKRIK